MSSRPPSYRARASDQQLCVHTPPTGRSTGRPAGSRFIHSGVDKICGERPAGRTPRPSASAGPAGEDDLRVAGPVPEDPGGRPQPQQLAHVRGEVVDAVTEEV